MANQKSDFDYLSWILSQDFISKGGFLKEEKEAKGKKTQKVKVVMGRGVTAFAIYEFGDKENCRHLPFFNHTNNHPSFPNAPSGLLAFCDYIILTEVMSKAYFLLVEMKRGVRSHATVQLNASRTFVDYVLATADRIKDANAMKDFDSAGVEIRRIVLSQTKKETLNSHMPHRNSKNDIIDYKTFNEFRIRDVI